MLGSERLRPEEEEEYSNKRLRPEMNNNTVIESPGFTPQQPQDRSLLYKQFSANRGSSFNRRKNRINNSIMWRDNKYPGTDVVQSTHETASREEYHRSYANIGFTVIYKCGNNNTPIWTNGSEYWSTTVQDILDKCNNLIEEGHINLPNHTDGPVVLSDPTLSNQQLSDIVHNGEVIIYVKKKSLFGDYCAFMGGINSSKLRKKIKTKKNKKHKKHKTKSKYRKQ